MFGRDLGQKTSESVTICQSGTPENGNPSGSHLEFADHKGGVKPKLNLQN
jgi:hypothetical protein